MPIASITVAAVTPPAPGKKRARVSDTEGNVYQVDGGAMFNFAPGSSWNIVYKDDSFNGHTFKVIEKFNPTSTVAAPQAGAAVPYQQHAAPSQTMMAPPKVDPLPERIFVCGALNAALGNPGVNPAALTEDQLVVMVNGFRRVFARTFGGRRGDATAPVPNPQQSEDMSDEIPF